MFMIGLLGAGHCLGMCGGITAALAMAVDSKKRPRILLAYNIGRISSYTIAGLFIGSLGYWGSEYFSLGPWLGMVAGVLLLLMGLYIAEWWKLLIVLERLGNVIWRRIQPLASRSLPVKNGRQALVAGMIWGWLPCGLVYSALAYAATGATPLKSAAMMLVFGLGTAPAVLLGGTFATGLSSLLQRSAFKQLMGLILVLFGLWVLWSGWQHLHADHSSHGSGHEIHNSVDHSSHNNEHKISE